MQLDIDVRFYDDKYSQIGRGHVNITSDNDDLPLATIRQLGAAIPALIEGLVQHAELEAAVSLKQLVRTEEKEKEAQHEGTKRD